VADLVKIKWELKLFERIKGNEKKALMDFIAANLQTNRAMIFDHEGAYNGRTKWKGLVFRKGMILSKSGDLRRSIAPRNNGVVPVKSANTILEFSGSKISIGSKLKYANLQDKGGKVEAKNAKALKIPVGMTKVPGRVRIGGKWYIFRKRVNIPSRPFTDWTPQDDTEIKRAITNFLASEM
jgi:phage gpG-like protein